jgi:hypothetical protein
VLQRIDPRQIGARLMLAAPLALDKAKATSSVEIGGPGAAQVNRGGEMLLLLEGSTGDSIARQDIRHVQV